MWRQTMIACVLLGGCVVDPAVRVGMDETIVLDQGANGDVTCQQGTLTVPAEASINGEIQAHYCVMEIAGTVNGSISTTGGILHVADVGSINGGLDVHDAYELIVTDSEFNGGASIDGTLTVLLGNVGFNGDVDISGVDTCEATDVRANGSYAASGCR